MSQMDVWAVDFETYYDTVSYTLKKLNTAAYVCDPRFEALCLAVWGKDDHFVLRQAEIQTWLSSIDPERTILIAQHAHFDGAILSRHYNFRPVFWLDTLSMSRALHGLGVRHNLDAQCARYGLPPKTVNYQAFNGRRWRDLAPDAQTNLCIQCLDDAERTYTIAQRQKSLMPFEELQIIDMNIRMFTEPTVVGDVKRLRAIVDTETRRKETVLADLGLTAKDLASDDKFEKILLGLGEEVEYKPAKNKRGFKGAFAKSDDYMVSLVNSQDHELSELAQARLDIKSTIQQTRAQRIRSAAERGQLMIYYNYFGTKNGRFSGADQENYQNIPSRGKNGVELRKSLNPPSGHVFVVADSSQVECRNEMAFAGQFDKLTAFREKRDLYCELASKLFGRTITKSDELERQLGKTILLQSGYGSGWRKVQATAKRAFGLALTDETAQSYIDVYRDDNTAICGNKDKRRGGARGGGLWQLANVWLQWLADGRTVPVFAPIEPGYPSSSNPLFTIDKHKVILPNGLMLHFDGLARGEIMGADGNLRRGWILPAIDGYEFFYGPKLVQYINSALARLILTQAMLRIKRAPYGKMVMMTHDDLVFCVPEDRADDAKAIVIEEMTVSPKWLPNLPLAVECSIKKDYAK
jgi:DNA polymerase I-like protein with 3'-5' exonuclease and polymerase domains